MREVQKLDHMSLTNLVGRLQEGRFVIPDFQRDFEWTPSDINNLIRSIFLDYYIGSLLLWKGKPENFDALACESIYAFAGTSDDREHIVLDGQQRLTAMYYAFMAPCKPAPRRSSRYRYFIRVNEFMNESYEEAFFYDWTKYGEIIANDSIKQYQNHMFPLSVIGQTGWELGNWVQGYMRFWEEAQNASETSQEAVNLARQNAENARAFGEHLKEITQKYQVAYIELDRDLELEKICDIFTQINSRGVRLSIFDLLNALLRPKGLRLRHMWREAEQRLDFVDTNRMNVYVLQVMSILCQGYCSPKYLYYLLPGQERQVREPGGSLRKDVLVENVAEFENRWNQAVDSLEGAIALLSHPQEFGAISSEYLPYLSVLPVFAALQTSVGNLPHSRQLDAQRKIRQWYWASVFLNRYSGAVESTSARDFSDLKAWFDLDTDEPALISEFRERFRPSDLRRETRRGTSVYNGIFNLLVLNGARDWSTGKAPQHDDLDDHHIVPRAWGQGKELGPLDSILNRTPLSANTNRNVIGGRPPNEYLPELIADNDEDTVREILESHLISPSAFDILLRDPFTSADFEAFLSERQRTIQNAIEDLLVKSRLALSPRLRELDTKIESVELSLRQHLADKLQDNSAELPTHVKKKIEERLEQAAKKNPALDVAEFTTLSSKLEYADLRELQDTIVTKALWDRFEGCFKNKGQVTNRFDHLIELRNCIRHSRKVTELTQRDGEAAILWFTHALPGSI